MSVKDCGHHKDKYWSTKGLRKKIAIFLGFLVLAGLIAVLIAWLILRPVNPVFILQEATVPTFNLSGPPNCPNFVTSTFQLTVRSRNPNDRLAIYYDRLIVYATYGGQQITLPTSIPPAYQDKNEANIWSPFVAGVSIPIAPYIGLALSADQLTGKLPITIKMYGKIRWRVGAIITRGYRLHVKCPALFAVSNPQSTTSPFCCNAVEYQPSQSCIVHV